MVRFGDGSGTFYDYKTWGERRYNRSSYEYFTSCGWLQKDKLLNEPGCDHEECALEIARQNLAAKGGIRIFNIFIVLLIAIGAIIMWPLTLIALIMVARGLLHARNNPVPKNTAIIQRTPEQTIADLTEFMDRATINGVKAQKVAHRHDDFWFPPVPLE